MAYDNQDPAGKALSSIKKEYAMIGKRHIKTWQVCLIVGVLAGAVGAVALVAKNSADQPLALKFEKSSAAEIVPIENSIHVLSPNGGEIWVKGRTVPITWESFGILPATLDIQINSLTGPGVVVTGVQNNGQYYFTVPNTLPERNDYFVVVGAGLNTSDRSDGVFTIVPSGYSAPAIASVLVSPNRFSAGTSFALSVFGDNFGSAPGYLDILDEKTNKVIVSINATNKGAWDLTWGPNGIVVIFAQGMTSGYTPGTYVAKARVTRAGTSYDATKQNQSNIVPFWFTVK